MVFGQDGDAYRGFCLEPDNHRVSLFCRQMLSVKCFSLFLVHSLPAYLFLFPLCVLFHLSHHSFPQSPLFSIPAAYYSVHLPPRCVEVPRLPLSFSITEPPPILLRLPSLTDPPSSVLIFPHDLIFSLSLCQVTGHMLMCL